MNGSAEAHVDASPERVWAMVSDLPRMGEWSPENRGGEWLDGADGPAVGARFRGRNKAKLPWTTTATVTECDPGRVFEFTVGDDTRWRYELTPAGDGTDVVQSFEILRPPMVLVRWLNRVGTGVSWTDRPAQLVEGMERTLANLKAAAEG